MRTKVVNTDKKVRVTVYTTYKILSFIIRGTIQNMRTCWCKTFAFQLHHFVFRAAEFKRLVNAKLFQKMDVIKFYGGFIVLLSSTPRKLLDL